MLNYHFLVLGVQQTSEQRTVTLQIPELLQNNIIYRFDSNLTCTDNTLKIWYYLWES